MEKKKKIIIGASAGGASILALGLGLGLGLGLKSNDHVNDPAIEAKYVAYRNDFIKQLCSQLYEENKASWSQTYTDMIKSNLQDVHVGLNTDKEWWDGFNLFIWTHQPKNGELYLSWLNPSKMELSGNQDKEWRFSPAYLAIRQWKDGSTDENPDPTLVETNGGAIVINKQ